MREITLETARAHEEGLLVELRKTRAALRVIGGPGADNIEMTAGVRGIKVEMVNEEERLFSRLDYAAALQVGEWLIAQAIAHGATRQALAALPSGEGA